MDNEIKKELDQLKCKIDTDRDLLIATSGAVMHLQATVAAIEKRMDQPVEPTIKEVTP